MLSLFVTVLSFPPKRARVSAKFDDEITGNGHGPRDLGSLKGVYAGLSLLNV